MKPTFLLLFVLGIIISNVSNADSLNSEQPNTYAGSPENQSDKKPSGIYGRFGLWSFTMPVSDHKMFGAGFDIQLFYSPRFSTGFSMSTNLKSIHDGLGIAAGEPLLSYFDINIYQEYKIISKKAAGLSARFYTGSASLSLRDGSILEPHVVQDDDNTTHIEMRPKKVTAGSFYRLSPALVAQFRLLQKIDLEAVGGYNFFCDGSFGNQKSLNGYFVQLGVKFGRRDY